MTSSERHYNQWITLWRVTLVVLWYKCNVWSVYNHQSMSRHASVWAHAQTGVHSAKFFVHESKTLQLINAKTQQKLYRYRLCWWIWSCPTFAVIPTPIWIMLAVNTASQLYVRVCVNITVLRHSTKLWQWNACYLVLEIMPKCIYHYCKLRTQCCFSDSVVTSWR